MALVKVRIAPVEKWCPDLLKRLEVNPRYADAVGKEIVIATNSMKAHPLPESCPGLNWLVPEAYATQFKKQFTDTEIPPMDRWVCEHALEMD